MAKVLIVDDNMQNCEIIQDLLCTWGYTVCIANEGIQALSLASKNKPDAIILDVMLPGMNGFEICKKFKGNASTQNIPIIMLTVLSEVEDRLRGFNVGADVFLSKPIVYQELKNRLAWAIDSRKLFNNMECANKIVESFLKVMQLKDDNLYIHACKVREYCEKVGKILLVTDQKMDQLLIGAYIHDIGKIISDEDNEHVNAGVQIIEPLKMCKWLKSFIRNHHEKINGQGFPDGLKEQDMSLELKIIIAINRFVELWDETGSKDISVDKLEEECKKGYWSIEVLDAIKQVLKDELFKKSIGYN